MEFDTKIKLKIYEMIASSAVMPTSIDIAEELGETVEDVEASFNRLYTKRLLVLEPDKTSEIRMAPPFSGIETPFLVEVGEKSYYANCVWDAFGVAAALNTDATIRASDGYTGELLTLEIRNSKPV
jgi:hypothetical protein